MHFQRAAAAASSLSALLAACSGGNAPSPFAPRSKPTPTSAATPGPVLVSVSASTNTSAYTILLQQSDSATYTQSGGQAEPATVPAADATQFFNDLNANTPVSGVQTLTACVKSASFGTTTTLVYEGSTSGDISCPPEAPPVSPAQTLWTDAVKIEEDVQNSLASGSQ